MKHLSKEQYIQLKRKEACQIIGEMLNGSICYLSGSIMLSSLMFEIDVPEDDTDFLVFVAIASETDNLPNGEVRKNWSKTALYRLEPEIQKATKWAKDISVNNCESIIARFCKKT